MILNYFLVFSILLSILYAIGELSIKKRTSINYYLFIIFCFLAILQYNSFLWVSEFILEFPHLLYINIPVVVLIGPILERYLYKMWDIDQEDSSRFYKKIFLSTLFLFLFLNDFLKSAEEKRILVQAIYTGKELIVEKIGKFASILLLLSYELKITFRFSKEFRAITLKKSSNLKIILLILLLSLVTTFLALLSIAMGNSLSATYNGILIGLFLCVVYMIRQRYPEFFLEVKNIAVEEKKYKTSQLRNFDLGEIKLKLENLLQIEKIYKDDSINLSSLSGRLGLTPHQFSEFLNQELKINFFQLINKHRIEEAKKLLRSDSKKTILAIAFEVGYQNKSTFNEIFKKETGLTPTEWKKKSSNL